MNVFSFSDTVQRKTFWMVYLLYVLIAFVGVALLASEATAILGLVMCALVLYLNLTLITKRIRDTGCSGWFAILNILLAIIPYVGFIIQIIWFCLPTNFFHRYAV